MPPRPTQCDLWLINLAAAGPALRHLEHTAARLSDDQRAEFALASAPERSRKRIAAHVALRLALERLAGRAAVAGVPIVPDYNGRPSLPDCSLGFSISYSGENLLIGISAQGAIGVDLECPRPIRLSARRREGVIAVGQELAPQSSLPGRREHPQAMDGDANMLEARFLQAWTRMEAVAKGTGLGIGRVLGHFGLVGAPKPHSARSAAAVKKFIQDYDMSVADLECTHDHFGAIALTGAGNRLDCARQPVWLPCDGVGLAAFAAGEQLPVASVCQKAVSQTDADPKPASQKAD